MGKVTLLTAKSLVRAIDRMAHEIAERTEGEDRPMILGIQRGGVHIGARLGRVLESIWKQPVGVGTLDVVMHRDDIHGQMVPSVQPTRLPGDINGRSILLVDDVLFTGRTVRAALDAVSHLGRPKRIRLAVLIDRGHRELPIQPDFVGKEVTTTLQERIDVRLAEETGEDCVELIRATSQPQLA